jgi:hypothetical protein
MASVFEKGKPKSKEKFLNIFLVKGKKARPKIKR